MYIAKSLKLTNFGPFLKAEKDFIKNVSLLTGENLTDDGQESNGSGKSIFIEAFFYSIIGSSLRKVTDKELVREGEKEASLELLLENKQLGTDLLIKRKVFSNTKSATLEVFYCGEPQNQITSVKHGNKFILEEIGLSREDITNYYIISKEKYISFFSSSDNDKKELISRFSKSNIIDDAFPLAQKDIDEKNQEVAKIEREILSIEGKIEFVNEQIEKENEPVEDTSDEEIKAIQNKILLLQEENDLKEGKVHDFKKIIEQTQEKYDSLPDVSDLKEKITQKEMSVTEAKETTKLLEQNRNETKHLISELKLSLTSVITCPNCSHEFSVADKDFKPKEAREQIEELGVLVEDFSNDIVQAELTKKELEGEWKDLENELNSFDRQKNKLQNEIDRSRIALRSAENAIENNERSMKSHFDQIESIENRPVRENKTKEYKKQVQEFKTKLEALEKEMEKALGEAQHFEEVKGNLKSFKTHLANKSLNSINGYANIYLEKLGSSIRVKFEGYKELASGDIREQISVKILKFGENVGSFGKLSGGEKARVELSTILAISSLINQSSPSGGLGNIIIDEILESLDGLGLQLVLKALGGVDQFITLVTQNKVKTSEGFEEILIRKENGISTIV